MFEIVVEADMNDGDYITKNSEISKEDLEKFQPVFDAINKFNVDNKRSYNWNTVDNFMYNLTILYPDVDVYILEDFNEIFVPYSEYGIHTITSIVYYELPTKTRLV